MPPAIEPTQRNDSIRSPLEIKLIKIPTRPPPEAIQLHSDNNFMPANSLILRGRKAEAISFQIEITSNGYLTRKPITNASCDHFVRIS
jgi:hypothetical protein